MFCESSKQQNRLKSLDLILHFTNFVRASQIRQILPSQSVGEVVQLS